ncbi:hypothetical protein AHF37_06032 [Paragonimus kellicotti]|nr:hypothetical protein AHF37_06032 [Paragonimus kellicotti]
MHAELREQLAEVVKRIENLELQVGQINQSISHASSVIPPTPTTSHYLAPPVETLGTTRPRTDPATHPKLQNLNEESFEESKRIPAENQPPVTVSTKPTLATSNTLDDSSVQTISVTHKEDPGCPNIYSTAFVEMETGLKLLGQTLNKTLLTMHAELREQLAEVVKRIENLELQVGQINQSISHASSVIPPTPTTSHYLAPPVETLGTTRPRTDPFPIVKRKDR